MIAWLRNLRDWLIQYAWYERLFGEDEEELY
jgi:hypothetical protein